MHTHALSIHAHRHTHTHRHTHACIEYTHTHAGAHAGVAMHVEWQRCNGCIAQTVVLGSVRARSVCVCVSVLCAGAYLQFAA